MDKEKTTPYKSAREIFPTRTCIDGTIDILTDYDTFFNNYGNVVIQNNIGDYEGDYHILYDNGGKFGYLTFGYASYWDALHDCNTYDELDKLIEETYKEIKNFETPQAVVDYILSTARRYEWWWYHREGSANQYTQVLLYIVSNYEVNLTYKDLTQFFVYAFYERIGVLEIRDFDASITNIPTCDAYIIIDYYDNYKYVSLYRIMDYWQDLLNEFKRDGKLIVVSKYSIEYKSSDFSKLQDLRIHLDFEKDISEIFKRFHRVANEYEGGILNDIE